MKSYISFFALLLSFCLYSHASAYSGGNGTTEPFQIANLDDFFQLCNTPDDWGKSFVLTADIDLTGYVFAQAPIAPDVSDDVDFQWTRFSGVFDGGGHTISNLTITAPNKDFIGLFGYVGSGGPDSSQIKNLGVINVNIQGRNFVGGLAGWNNSTISGCYATGSVTGASDVGGLAGVNGRLGPSILNSYSTCDVIGNSAVGGLAGINYHSLSSCYATGAISGIVHVGGLVGDNYVPSFNYLGITNCYATGAVMGDHTVGGLAGTNNYGTISSSYATGSVSGAGALGGLVADNNGTIESCCAFGSVTGVGDNCFFGGLVASNSGSITRCYATGAVAGGISAGGLVGWNFGGVISRSYAAGAVSGTQFGGFVGDDSGTLTNSFWDATVSGTTDGVGSVNPDPSGITPKTTAEMQTLSTFTEAGWDFSATDGDAPDWVLESGQYPILIWQFASTPPVAEPITLTLSAPDTARIELLATDDGLPGPLSYVITSLPEHGILYDPGFGQIAAVPYVLLNDLHAVDYLPCMYASGTDQFTYIANDGGAAPNGGDSNEAQVTLTLAFNYDAAVHDTSNILSDYPFFTTWDDFRMQIIYRASEFGDVKKINALEFRFYRAPSAMSNFTIRMQHTPMDRYISGSSDFVNDGWTTVFQDNHTVSATGWHRIDFETPFMFNGTDNVLLDISYNNTNGGTTYGRNYAFDTGDPNRIIFQKSRSNHGDPLLWTAAMFGGVVMASDLAPVLRLHGGSPVDAIASDFNMNCSVGIEDLLALIDVWMSQQGDGVYDGLYDISSPVDAVINLADYAVLASDWLSGPFDFPPVYPTGDFDTSGQVDLMDLSTLLAAWLSHEGDANYNAACDISPIQDQVIDMSDFAVFSTHWMETL